MIVLTALMISSIRDCQKGCFGQSVLGFLATIRERGEGRRRGRECDRPKGCIENAQSEAHQLDDWILPFCLFFGHHHRTVIQPEDVAVWALRRIER